MYRPHIYFIRILYFYLGYFVTDDTIEGDEFM